MFTFIAISLVIVIAIGLFQSAILTYLGIKLRARLRALEHRVFDSTYWVYFDRSLNPKVPFPRVGAWTVTTDFLVELSRILHAKKPQLVVELGSGLSTVVVGLTLKAIGSGRLISVDHEREQADKSRGLLAQNELDDIASVRFAPLKPCDLNDAIEWYDVAQLEDLSGIDIVIVDGPPAEFHDAIRRPAFSYFWNRLSPGGLIIADDANRSGERAALREAQGSLPGAEIEYLSAEKGMAVLKKTS